MPKIGKTTSEAPAKSAGNGKGAPNKGSPSKSKSTVQVVEREVEYSDFDVLVFRGAEAMTAARAKEFLKWRTEEDVYLEETAGKTEKEASKVKIDFGENFMLLDDTKRKVRCLANVHNRPFDLAHSQRLAQDILQGHWKFNGETIIIGRTGVTLSGQHRLIGLILAVQKWARLDPETGLQHRHWLDRWPTEPTIECLVSVGIEESPEVTRTLDNVKPRTLADVLYADGEFGKKNSADRARLCKVLDYAVKLLWHRTGTRKDAYAPQRTHSEALDFIGRHGRVKEMVVHLFGEDNAGDISKKLKLPVGTASGLCYLMAASASDRGKYVEADPPSEKVLNFRHKVKVPGQGEVGIVDWAREYWIRLVSGNADLKAVRDALLKLHDSEEPTLAQKRVAILVKGWRAFVDGRMPTAKDISLADCCGYTEGDNQGEYVLKHMPEMGGIDVGDKDEDEKDDPPVNEDEAERIKARIRGQQPPPPSKDKQMGTGHTDRRAPDEVKGTKDEWVDEDKGTKGKGPRKPPVPADWASKPTASNGSSEAAEKPAKRAARAGSRKALQEDRTRQAAEEDARLASEAALTAEEELPEPEEDVESVETTGDEWEPEVADGDEDDDAR